MSTPLEYIASRASAYLSNSTLDSKISEASKQLSQTAFGDLYYKAVGLLVCHWCALEERSKQHGNTAPSGNVSSEKTGDWSRSFSGGFFSGTVQSSLDPYLAQTSWGVELSNLQQSCVPLVYFRGIR